MIRTFRHRGLKQLFLNDDSSLLDHRIVGPITLILDALDAIDTVQEMNYQGNYLHELKGARKGTWSVRVSGNWRITFRFEGGDAWDVNLEDYP